MHQVYNLDLDTMLSTLARRQLSGRLVADLAKGKVGRAPTHLEIDVDSGKVTSCSLQSGSIALENEKALQVIAQLEVIPWIFTPTLPQASAQTSQLTSTEKQLLLIENSSNLLVPRRVNSLGQGELARLPRRYFHVYAYIDGKRSVEEIAQLLRITVEQLQPILAELRRWKIIY